MKMAADITSILMEAPTKYELFHLLLNFSDKWYDIGLSLQVRRNVLDNIKPRLWYNNDKLRAVIDKFSTTELSPVTWETVISAMESPTIDNKAIANKIRQYLSTDITSILKETPNERELLRPLIDIRHKWYDIGLTLQVRRNDLDDLKQSEDDDITKLKKVINIWKGTERSSVTWKGVINAMKSPDNKMIVNRIHCHLKLGAFDRFLFNLNPDIEVSDSGTNKKLLDKAMKEGYVTAKWSKFSVSGAPGTGKSSFLKLLYNEPSPEHHDSTSVVATHEARNLEIISSAVGDKYVWTKIDYTSLKEMITQGVKDGIRHHELHVDEVKEHGLSEATPVDQPLELESCDHPTDHQEETADSDDSESSTTAGYDPLVSQEIVNLLPHVEKSEKLYQSHWIYGVDTGGQAAFIDIAPALLRYHSVNILTHKLTERLDDKAKFFFSVKGNVIGKPVEKQITNFQFLEASFRSLSSVNSPELPNIHITHFQEPYCIVLGTFLDKLLKTGESLEEKNEHLWATVEKFGKVIKHRTTTNEVIFPVNTTGRGDTELEMATRIRNIICKYYIEAQIPIRWFIFQLELDLLHKSSKSSIVSKSKCLVIGKSLQMKCEDIEAALMYYHDLTIFLYFPKILPNVVFLHPQPIFDRLSDLISISFADVVDQLEKRGIYLNKPRAHEELKVQGTFEETLLSLPNSHLSQGFSSDFSVKDFLKLMTSLFIFASLPEQGKYFIPTVLPTVDLTQAMKAPFIKVVDPLILSWDMKPLPKGLFPALMVNLLHYQGFPRFYLPHAEASNEHLRYRNAITLSIDAGYILLVDSIYWMEVYYAGPSNRCFAIRTAIHAGIQAIIGSFHYMRGVQTVDENFYCKICSDKCHFCRIDHTKNTLTCCVSPQTTYIHESRQKPWFLVKGTPDILNTAPDEHNMLKLLADIDHQWFVLGSALNVSYNILNGLKSSQDENKVKLIQVIHTWLTTQPSPVTWETVISAIEGKIVGNLVKANEIRDCLGLPLCQQLDN